MHCLFLAAADDSAADASSIGPRRAYTEMYYLLIHATDVGYN